MYLLALTIQENTSLNTHLQEVLSSAGPNEAHFEVCFSPGLKVIKLEYMCLQAANHCALF